MGEATPVGYRQSGTPSGRFDPARLISVIGKVPGSARVIWPPAVWPGPVVVSSKAQGGPARTRTMIGSRRQVAYPPCDAPEDLLDQWIEYLNFLMCRADASMIRDTSRLEGVKW